MERSARSVPRSRRAGIAVRIVTRGSDRARRPFWRGADRLTRHGHAFEDEVRQPLADGFVGLEPFVAIAVFLDLLDWFVATSGDDPVEAFAEVDDLVGFDRKVRR